jgi:hypothetical protein
MHGTIGMPDVRIVKRVLSFDSRVRHGLVFTEKIELWSILSATGWNIDSSGKLYINAPTL